MPTVTGRFFIDGVDIWDVYRVFIEKGSADFLQYAPKKQSIEHDWQDANGIDVDLTRVFFGPREITLNCAIVTDSELEFWPKHNAFIAFLTQPGLRRITLTSHGERSYFVFYKECSGYSQAIPLKGSIDPGKIAHKFALQIIEPEPVIDSELIFIVDEDGRFLVT